MKNLIRKILFEEKLKEIGYYGNVLTQKLPQELDNRLYTLIYMVGGMTSREVIYFANNATPKEVRDLYTKIMNFPSTQQDLIPLAGGHKELRNSPEYQTIVDLVKFKNRTLMEQRTETDEIFNRFVKPEYKNAIFKLWDKLGEPDYSILKYFDIIGEDEAFDNVLDVVYPLLAIEWYGGVENSNFAKAPWKETNESGFSYLRFKVEPIGFDYLYDESDGYGEHGYACWDIRVLIDKDGDIIAPGDFVDYDNLPDEEPFIQSLFPESARNKLSSHRNYTEDQQELIEMLWDHYDEDRDLSSQFCRVEVKLV
tara:strand:- start:40575 stop:41504 length:930 start_codon:yes stop_codon:yes gene_type:complete